MERDPQKGPEIAPPAEETPQGPIPVGQRIFIAGSSIKPIFTIILIGVTVLFYIGQLVSKATTDTDILLALFARINPAIMNWGLWRLLTPVFVHGNLLHLALNMYALWVIGKQVEALFGRERYLMTYVLGAFGGNVLGFALSPSPSVGSSTAIFALIGAQLVYIFKNRRVFGENAPRLLIQIGLLILLNLGFAFIPGLKFDIWGHLGGLLAGIAFSILAAPGLKLGRVDEQLAFVDGTPKRDRYFAFLMVVFAFSLIAFVVIRRAMFL